MPNLTRAGIIALAVFIMGQGAFAKSTVAPLFHIKATGNIACNAG